MPHGVDSASAVDLSEPQFAKTKDGAYIAYQVVGDGPVDVAWQFGIWRTSIWFGVSLGIHVV